MRFIRNISIDPSSDAELIKRFRDDNSAHVLATLFSRYMELVYAVCIKYLQDPERAKDAVMDIYEELTFKLHKHEVTNFSSWLHTLARNHCLMKLRSRAARDTVNIDEDRMQFASDPHQELEEEKEQQFVILAECLQKLPEEQKRVIDLFYLQQQCYKDISLATGFEWNKVRSLVQNGRRNLKLCIEKITRLKTERTG